MTEKDEQIQKLRNQLEQLTQEANQASKLRAELGMELILSQFHKPNRSSSEDQASNSYHDFFVVGPSIVGF